MAEIINLERKEQWLASLDLIRSTEGKLRLVLSDARTSLIEADPTDPAGKLRLIARMAIDGAEAMTDEAGNFEEAP